MLFSDRLEDVSPDKFMELNGKEVRDRFPEVINGVKGAIDFLKANVHVESLGNLPYSALLVPLSVFFAAPDGKSVKVSNHQRSTLLEWFWRSCFSRRFSAGVIRNLNRDIKEARQLRDGIKSELARVPASVDESFFTEQTFNIGTVHTKVFILLLAQAAPLSFVSGQKITLRDVLQAYNRKEFHHLYPQAYLRDQGREPREINALANFVFMSSADNKELGGVAPSIYRSKIDTGALPKILEHSYCPAELFDDDFDEFVVRRARTLVDIARRLANISG